MVSIERHFTLPDRQEVLYRRLERKVVIIGEVWSLARDLLYPTADDSIEAVDTERQAFYGIVERAKSFFPEVMPSYQRHKELSEEYHHLEETYTSRDSQRMDEVEDELAALEQNDDLVFVNSIEYGIERALEQRHQVRTIMKKVGNRRYIPTAYEQFIPEHKGLIGIKGHITRVIPESFSITLVVDSEVFQQEAAEPYSNGCHIEGTVWNVVSEIPFGVMLELSKRLNKLGITEGEEITEELRGEFSDLATKAIFNNYLSSIHENAHVFLSGFNYAEREREPFALEYGYRLVQSRLDLLRKALRKKDSSSVRTMKQAVLRSLQFLEDARYDEFLAELATYPEQEIPDVPRQTFGVYMRRKQRFLRKRRGRNPVVGRMIDHTLERLNVDNVREKVSDWYVPTQDDEETRKRLDAAFALILPSKWRHIDRLIKRWTTQTEQP